MDPVNERPLPVLHGPVQPAVGRGRPGGSRAEFDSPEILRVDVDVAALLLDSEARRVPSPIVPALQPRPFDRLPSVAELDLRPARRPGHHARRSLLVDLQPGQVPEADSRAHAPLERRVLLLPGHPVALELDGAHVGFAAARRLEPVPVLLLRYLPRRHEDIGPARPATVSAKLDESLVNLPVHGEQRVPRSGGRTARREVRGRAARARRCRRAKGMRACGWVVWEIESACLVIRARRPAGFGKIAPGPTFAVPPTPARGVRKR